MENFTISSIDYAIVAIYFFVVLTIGVMVARKTKSGDDLFLAGRSLAWGAIGFSLFASNISSTTLVGLAGSAYQTGLAVSSYEWMAALVLVFMAVFYVPFYIGTRISTIPEFLERRYSRKTRLYFSSITIFLSIMVDTAGGLYAGGLVLQTFFPGLDLTMTCVVLALVAGVYTAAGGLAAVVYTDVIQAVVLIVGTTLITVLAFGQFDYSWSQAVAGLPEGHMSLVKPMDDPNLPWLGLVVGLPILGFYYWVTNQYIVQRVLGGKSMDHARWGTLLGAALKLLPLFIMVLPGALAFKLFPGLDKADQVFPVMVANLLPVGVVGLVLAGLVAAIMSSIDSTLNSASTLVTLDFVLPRHPEMSSKQVARIGRICTGIFMVIAAAWAPFIAELGGLFDYLQTAFSYIAPPLAVLFLVGLFWPRANAYGAIATLALGHSVSLILFILGPGMGVINIHFTIMAGLLTLFASVVFVVTSLMTAPPPPESRALTWAGRDRKATAAGAVPLWANYKAQAIVVVGLVAMTVIAFW